MNYFFSVIKGIIIFLLDNFRISFLRMAGLLGVQLFARKSGLMFGAQCVVIVI